MRLPPKPPTLVPWGVDGGKVSRTDLDRGSASHSLTPSLAWERCSQTNSNCFLVSFYRKCQASEWKPSELGLLELLPLPPQLFNFVVFVGKKNTPPVHARTVGGRWGKGSRCIATQQCSSQAQQAASKHSRGVAVAMPLAWMATGSASERAAWFTELGLQVGNRARFVLTGVSCLDFLPPHNA